ncbi:MAG: hypothetical protein PHT69_14680 [Bacteroidales bacterium]|nr:hypothetical protein [Bacteroidales bacterium]
MSKLLIRIILIFVLFEYFFLPLVNAQEKIDSKNFDKHICFKLNVTSLIDYTPSIQFAVQYNILNRLCLQHEAGYITHYLSPFWDKKSNLNGFRIKNQIKYYWTKSDNEIQFFSSIDFNYKKIVYMKSEWFQMYDMSYFQECTYQRTKEVFVPALLSGVDIPLTDNGWIVELYAGLGYRNLIISDNLPEDAIIARGSIFRRTQGVYHLPNFSFGVRLGYKLKFS